MEEILEEYSQRKVEKMVDKEKRLQKTSKEEYLDYKSTQSDNQVSQVIENSGTCVVVLYIVPYYNINRGYCNLTIRIFT